MDFTPDERELFRQPVGIRMPDGRAWNPLGKVVNRFEAGPRQALALIGALPRDQAEAVLLRVVVGLDGPSAARVLGKRPGAVRAAAHRGLKKLAARLAQGVPPRSSRALKDEI